MAEEKVQVPEDTPMQDFEEQDPVNSYQVIS
jgi:hypothetical protein